MSLQIDIVTIFPSFFKGPLQESILKRAQAEGHVKIQIHNLRDYTHDRHKTVDDKPFGGGAGMIMKIEPIFECLEAVRKKSWVVLMGPHGKPFTQKSAERLARKKQVVLIAGHYEGIDYRVGEHLVDEEISIGDFVTMGGEAPALCVIEAIVRLLPGVLGNAESLKHESFYSHQLEYPQYTRPREFKEWIVPEVLMSGHHREVEKWRDEMAKKITKQKRPDLLKIRRSSSE